VKTKKEEKRGITFVTEEKREAVYPRGRDLQVGEGRGNVADWTIDERGIRPM